MNKLIRYLFFLTIFWLLLFTLNRFLFLIVVRRLLEGVQFSDKMAVFGHGLRLDFSAVSYLTLLPFIFALFYYGIRNLYFKKIAHFLVYAEVIIYNLISLGEDGLYTEWKTKLNIQALSHLSNPDEVFRTAPLGLTLVFIGGVSLISAIFIWVYRRWGAPLLSDLFSIKIIPRAVKSFSGLLLFGGFCIIGIRGGLQPIPISESDAYFSNNPVLNDAAVNPLWSLVHNYLEFVYHLQDNPFKVMDDTAADQIVRDMYQVAKDSTVSILTEKRPNVVFILLESWSAWCVESFGGDRFAPFVDSLAKDGVAFTQFYPAGYVSDQGIPAILSSYPSTARISIINDPHKSLHIPCINEELEKAGYQSGFFFGGELNYGNIKGYLYNKKFNVIREEKDFPSELPRAKLGVHDGYMAHEFLKGLNAAQKPFFYCWFTLSSHIPYDIPEPLEPMTAYENGYVNSVRYADKALRSFFSEASREPWFENTLFVIVADHSHDCHRAFPAFTKDYHRIPLLLYGKVLKPEWRGKKVDEVFSQLDITPSILKQLGLDNSRYTWGKDMFNPYSPNFAFYSYYSGGGLVAKEGYVAFQKGMKELVTSEGKDSLLLRDLERKGKAYQQAVYSDYMKK